MLPSAHPKETPWLSADMAGSHTMALTAPKNGHGMVCIISPVERFQTTNSASSPGMVKKISKVPPGSYLAELIPPLSSLSHSGLIAMAFT